MIPPPMFNGIVPYIRIFLQLYLIYLSLVKKVRIPGWYFILVALANMAEIKRMIDLNNNNDYSKIHGHKNLYEMPRYHEVVISVVINFIAGTYLLIR